MTPEDSGERQLQREIGSTKRADRFYDRQMLDSLNETMINLIRQQEMFFMATADASGNCDCSPRFGEPGFVHVIDPTTLAYPDYRGNGVFASLGNIMENPHIGKVFLDFFNSTVGLHVNGEAKIFPNGDVPPGITPPLLQIAAEDSRLIERWVVITVEEAYIHCSKHVPRLQKMQKKIDWGTDDTVAKSDNYFVGQGETQ